MLPVPLTKNNELTNADMDEFRKEVGNAFYVPKNHEIFLQVANTNLWLRRFFVWKREKEFAAAVKLLRAKVKGLHAIAHIPPDREHVIDSREKVLRLIGEVFAFISGCDREKGEKEGKTLSILPSGATKRAGKGLQLERSAPGTADNQPSPSQVPQLRELWKRIKQESYSDHDIRDEIIPLRKLRKIIREAFAGLEETGKVNGK
ncbi:MAG: hypothetical protein HY376_03170 [Candidatus Blackburnbacteria bacterium]|nr:hypothetical protein [Candidatus Blackburnbacteria bacterium]